MVHSSWSSFLGILKLVSRRGRFVRIRYICWRLLLSTNYFLYILRDIKRYLITSGLSSFVIYTARDINRSYLHSLYETK